MKTSLISADPPTLVCRAIVGAITNSTAEMSLKMPDCVNFPARCHAEIIGPGRTPRGGILKKGAGGRGQGENTKQRMDASSRSGRRRN